MKKAKARQGKEERTRLLWLVNTGCRAFHFMVTGTALAPGWKQLKAFPIWKTLESSQRSLTIFTFEVQRGEEHLQWAKSSIHPACCPVVTAARKGHKKGEGMEAAVLCALPGIFPLEGRDLLVNKSWWFFFHGFVCSSFLDVRNPSMHLPLSQQSWGTAARAARWVPLISGAPDGWHFVKLEG